MENNDLHSQANGQDRKKWQKKHDYLTTDQGVKINHTDDSLKAGQRGPTLMEDFHFREKMTHFDHERIPERVVHARGSGAHGYFQVYEPMTELTKAKFLSDPQVKTPVFVRFSTVVGSKGSGDTVRDARGFATKFYTQDGNYDLVANNIPVFFIQDGIKFPDLVHSIKPQPRHQMPQASAAHDNFWDFISLMPESMNMIMWLLSDRGIPRSFSMMEGFGVHTFRFINEQGKARFVKFHWKPLKGVHSLVWDEAQKLAGKDPDFLRRDLWESIEMGDFPEYELGVQIVEEEDEHKYAFDILDATKIIPEELVPVKKIGKMVLNRNPDNFFAETEQVAFHPGNVVPGIDFTNDPLLQGRLFSYLDTQLTRLGGPNFAELPINRPIVHVNNNQDDGFSRHTIKKSNVNYFPNTLGGGCPMMAPENMGGYVHYMEKVDGRKVRERSESFNDHFSQARLFWNSMTMPERKHIIKAFHFELGKVADRGVRERMVQLVSHVDLGLAEEVALGIGVEGPSGNERLKEGIGRLKEKFSKLFEGKVSVDSSPAVSMENKEKNAVKGRKVAVLLAEGYNYEDVEQVKGKLKEFGVSALIVSMFRGMVKSHDGRELEVDKSYVTTGSIMFDAVLVPGGKACVDALKMQGDAIHFINESFRHCKPIAAIGEGIGLLQASDIEGIELAGEGNAIVKDNGVLTCSSPDNLLHFGWELVEVIRQHRYWMREELEMVPA